MIQEIIIQWEENKHKIESYFRTTEQLEYNSYEKILKKIFELCINKEYRAWSIDNIITIDHGSYSGTQIFIIPLDEYVPNYEDYLVTHTYYGSCSGCDTLLSISDYDSALPSKRQISEYMTLCLHLIQKMKYLP